MPDQRITVKVAIEPQPRPTPGSTPQTSKEFEAQSLVGAFAWGSSPGTATVVYAGDDSTIQTGSLVTLRMGAHTIYGLCRSDTGQRSAQGGVTRTLEYVDLRDFLTWDYVFGAFNKPDVRLVNGVRQKRYKHLFPVSYDDWQWIYTDTPLLAWQMVAEILQAPTVGSPWLWDLTGNGEFGPLMNVPVYDMDFTQGERLDSILNRISQALGLVYGCLTIGKRAYHLTWTRKGYGTLTIPLNSDARRQGVALSGNATNVRVLGDRNRYQILDITMVKDWAAAWEGFITRDGFVEDIYQRGSDVNGVRFNAIPNDTERYQGRLKALARALSITVREYVALRNGESAGSGTPFEDKRLFNGRPRMDMPAVLYIETLLFRSFKPSGLTLPNGWDLSNRMVCRVSHAPGTGDMTAYPLEQAEGNGYAVAKGYNVGQDLFRTVKSDQFDLDFFKVASAVWQHAPFQVDDSGEGSRFIIFDEPVFTAENLIVDGGNGIKVVNAAFTLTTPAVKAALTFDGEVYSFWQGTYPNVSRDIVVPAQGVHQEFVVKNNIPMEVAYASGQYANDLALQVANHALLRQYDYIDGGYRHVWDPLTMPVANFGTQLSSLIDRVQIVITPDQPVHEMVDFTTERQRDSFEPERDLDRAVTLDVLFPGQAELRAEAEDAQKLAAGLRQSPELQKRLNDILTGGLSVTPASGVVWIPTAGAVTLPAGSIIRKAPTTVAAYNTGTVGVLPTAATAQHNVFVGVTLRANEPANKAFRVANTGVAPALVQGPVNENDTVGLPSTGVNYFVKDGTPACGRVLQKITDTSTKLVLVHLGVGGGGGGELPIWR